MNKFTKMKVHWRTYNHCVFLSYLASAAFRSERISDTKFLKLSDKDWIWTCKNFSDMDQESKNQYPRTSDVHSFVCRLKRYELARALFFCCSLLRNNNMSTNLQRFTSSYNS